MTTLKKNSRIIEEMQETFADLKKSGVISKKQMAEFDALKNLEVKIKTVYLTKLKFLNLIH
jgi:putative transcriptional regulator